MVYRQEPWPQGLPGEHGGGTVGLAGLVQVVEKRSWPGVERLHHLTEATQGQRGTPDPEGIQLVLKALILPSILGQV